MDDRRNEPATKEDLREVEHKLTAKIDANAAKIDAVNQRLTDVEQRLTAKIEANAAKIDANSAAIAKVSSQVVKNRELIEQRVSRDEFNLRFDELVTSVDKMMTILIRWDQERVATNTRIDHLETDVDKNKNDIKKIKTKLAMP